MTIISKTEGLVARQCKCCALFCIIAAQLLASCTIADRDVRNVCVFENSLIIDTNQSTNFPRETVSVTEAIAIVGKYFDKPEDAIKKLTDICFADFDKNGISALNDRKYSLKRDRIEYSLRWYDQRSDFLLIELQPVGITGSTVVYIFDLVNHKVKKILIKV